MQGEIVYLYAFDVASEILISKVDAVLASKPVRYEIFTDHTIPKDAYLYKPLAIELANGYELESGEKLTAFVHVYEIGVISVLLRVAVEFDSLKELHKFHSVKLKGKQSLDILASNICKDVCENLKEVIVKGSKILDPEAYTVFAVTDISNSRKRKNSTPSTKLKKLTSNEKTNSKSDVTKWIEDNRAEIAELLTENKPGVLSKKQIDEVLRINKSYSNQDATIIDWDAALVIDLNSYIDDVLYVLELANIQLEEYLVIDSRLDAYLNLAYEDLKHSQYRLFGPSSATLKTLRYLRVDVTKLNDEVTNITKFFGDWYLARIYIGASERFHLEQWQKSVLERLKQLDSLYNVVSSEINNLRMVLLEVLIVVFFAIDLIMMFLFRK